MQVEECEKNFHDFLLAFRISSAREIKLKFV